MRVELAVGVRPVSMAEMRPVQPVHAPVSYMGDGATGSSSHMLSSFEPNREPKCAGENSDMLISLVGYKRMSYYWERRDSKCKSE